MLNEIGCSGELVLVLTCAVTCLFDHWYFENVLATAIGDYDRVTGCDTRIAICSMNVAKKLRRLLTFYVTYVGFQLGNMFEAVSAWITVLICIERYVTMQWPHQAKLRFSRVQAKRGIWICVTLIMLFHLPMFFVLESVQKIRTTADNVTLRYYDIQLTALGNSSYYAAYIWARFALVQCVPLAILCVVNVLLLVLIWSSYSKQKSYASAERRSDKNQRNALLAKMTQYRVQLDKQEELPEAKAALCSPHQTGPDNLASASETAVVNNECRATSNLCDPAPPKTTKHTTRLDRQHQANNKLTVLSVAVIFFFLVGQIPQALAYVNIVKYFVPETCTACRPYVNLYQHFSHLLCLLTSAANFFLYVSLNQRFRHCLYQMCGQR